MATKEPEVRSVKMDDGRVVEFPGKRRLQKSSEVTADGKLQVRLDFENGETRLFTIAPAMVNQFALHGAEQKLGDEISGIEDLEDAIEAIDQLMTRLDAGDWTKEKGGGSGMAGASILAKALVKVSGQTIAVVREYLSKLDGKTKVALRASAEVAPVVKQLEDEKAARAAARGKASTVDVSATLAGLKALGAPPAEGASPLPTAPAAQA